MNMSRANQRNYYRILCVQPDAPLQIITSSYRTLMQKLKQHPDLGGEHANAALINEAYTVLTDPVNRAEQRIAREQAIVFFTGWPQQPGTRGTIKDLSPHGMLIHADQPLTEGQIIKASGELLSTVARVVNCRSLPREARGVYGIGVEFITLLLRQGHGTFFSADA